MIDHQDTEDLFSEAEPKRSAPAAEPAVEHRFEPSGDSIGTRLRAAREARGLSVADCGRQLHLPIKVLERLEAEDFGAPEHFVFLRGALGSYTRFLGLPPGSCDDVLRAVAPQEQPSLVSVARTSQTRWLLQRYGTAATYIVLTATIAVPLVLLGLRGGLHRPIARIVSLDQPAASTPAPPASVTAPRVTAVTPTVDDTPYRASMTPFAAIGLNDDNASAPAPGTPPASPAPAGQHTLTLNASADCWFEITDADGNKVDSGMLHAGDSRSWHSAGALHVTLGNAGGVSVMRDGQPYALDSVRHANVAHFDVFGSSGASEND
ncbi:MAG TPA: helix-turn-helix domain-containing protein [Rhodanobacteraceae bacterium]|nr:helix-turn-helix domain-containing protein [Rhodanobacteraceae bacterium]